MHSKVLKIIFFLQIKENSMKINDLINSFKLVCVGKFRFFSDQKIITIPFSHCSSQELHVISGFYSVIKSRKFILLLYYRLPAGNILRKSFFYFFLLPKEMRLLHKRGRRQTCISNVS